MVHLVGNVLKPVLHRLNACDHARQLGANDSLLEQWLAEYFALVSPPGSTPLANQLSFVKKINSLETFFDDRPLGPGAAASHDPSLVVEVAQYDKQAAVFRSEHVLYWNFDVVKCDECCSCGWRICRLDRLSFNAFTTGNEENCEAL